MSWRRFAVRFATLFVFATALAASLPGIVR